MELPSEATTKLRQFNVRSRSFSVDEARAPASPERSFGDAEDGQTLDPYYTSSYVAWTTDNPPPSVAGAHAISRSASSPILSTRHHADAYRQPQPYSSTHNIRSDPSFSYATEVQPYFNVKPLSPIAEQDYFSPERQSTALPPPDDSTLLTPTGSQYSGVTRKCL
jgi:hypothetical protein